jgi:hypothetical protein
VHTFEEDLGVLRIKLCTCQPAHALDGQEVQQKVQTSSLKSVLLFGALTIVALANSCFVPLD